MTIKGPSASAFPSPILLTNVIPTHNRVNLLQERLEAVTTQSLDPKLYEVIVVAERCEDGTNEFLETYNPPYNFRWCSTDSVGRGVSLALNLGIMYARGNVICLAGDDCFPSTDAYQTYLVHCRPGIAVLGPVFEAHGHEEIPIGLAHGDGPLAGGQCDTANAAIWRSDLFHAGLFDVDLTLWGNEDIDMGFSLEENGVLFRRVGCTVLHRKTPWSIDSDRFTNKVAEQLVNIAILKAKHPHRYP